MQDPNAYASQNMTYYQQDPAYHAQMQEAAAQAAQYQAAQYQAAQQAEYAAAPTQTATPLQQHQTVSQNAPSQLASWFNFSNPSYLKGLLAASGTVLLLTNPTVQKAVVRGTVKLWSLAQGGVEEVKEQFQDIKAEMGQKE